MNQPSKPSPAAPDHAHRTPWRRVIALAFGALPLTFIAGVFALSVYCEVVSGSRVYAQADAGGGAHTESPTAPRRLARGEDPIAWLLGDACFKAYSGSIGSQPITLLLRRDDGPGEPSAWYYLNATRRYDPVTNRVRHTEIPLRDDGSSDDEIRLTGYEDETGTVRVRFVGRLSAEGTLEGVWLEAGASEEQVFSLRPMTVWRDGSNPSFSIRLEEATLEIPGEASVPLAGPGGLVDEPYTECGPVPFGVSVRRLPGQPELFAIELLEYGGWGFRNPKYTVFRTAGALNMPLFSIWELERCSTTAGLGWDCDKNLVRYDYAGHVLTVIDEKDQVRAIEPERYGTGGCLTVDRTLTVIRFEARSQARWLDKYVLIRGSDPGDCEEDEEARSESAQPAEQVPGWVTPALQPYLFDDGLSGWLLVPAQPQGPILRINQQPADPALSNVSASAILAASSSDDYNGPDTPLRAACWVYNRTASPERLQHRPYPPAPQADAFRLLDGGPLPLHATAIAENAYDRGDGASVDLGGLDIRWSKDGRALVAQHEGRPLMLFDGERCYHRHVKEAGRWGLPWNEEAHERLFAADGAGAQRLD